MKRLLTTLSIPAHTISVTLHQWFPWLPHRRGATTFMVGLLVCYVGSNIAHYAHHFEGQLSIIVDTAGYGVHGIGLAPVIKAIADTLKIEL